MSKRYAPPSLEDLPSVLTDFLEAAGYNFDIHPLLHEFGSPIIEVIPKFRQDWEEYEADRLEMNKKFSDFIFAHPDFVR